MKNALTVALFAILTIAFCYAVCAPRPTGGESALSPAPRRALVLPVGRQPPAGEAGPEAFSVADAGRAEAGRVSPGPVRPAGLERLFAAIRQVESGGDDRAVGDGGRSRGPYQIGRAYWRDGGGNPADYDRLVWGRAACEQIMLRYWQRYGATTDEQRARMHNGGPRGMKIGATVKYWQRIQTELKKGA